MKFVCDKCKTKYSIADEKVRRKVLKIRCKNCGNIVVVRDPNRKEPSGVSKGGGGSALDKALDGAFASLTAGTDSSKGGGGALAAVAKAPAPAPAFAPPEPDDELKTMIQSPLEALRTPVPEEDEGEDEWYLSVDGHQFGPMGFDELAKRIKRGEARGDDAYCWCDGFDDWLEVSKVPELRPYVPPPPPPGKSGLFPAAVVEPPADAMPPLPVGAISNVGPAPTPPPPRGPAMATPTGVPARPAPPQAPPSSPAMPAVVPPAPAAAPAPAPAPVAAGAPELRAMVDASLTSLPAAFASESPEATLPPSMVPAAAPAQPQSTQTWIKLAAISGILTMLIGILILVYVIFFDTGHPQPQHPGKPVVAANTGSPAPAVAPTRQRPAGSADAGTAVSMTFDKEDIKRTKERRVAGGRVVRPRATPNTGAAEAVDPKLAGMSARDRALLAAMKGGVGDHSPRKVAVKTKRRSRPTRSFDVREVADARRKNAFALKACYQKALKRDNSLKSIKAAVVMSISPDGFVRKLTVGGVNDYGLRACLTKSIKRWKFKPMGGRGVKAVEFSIEFRGN